MAPPSEAPPSQAVGRVYLVGGGPGAADLITLRGWRLLQKADSVVHDHLVDPVLYVDLPAELHDVGKRPGAHRKTQEEINALLVTLARRGHMVVRLKGGDPSVLGRAMEEAMHLAAHRVPCEIVPGITSAVAAPVLAGIPVTHRGLADSFEVVSAHPRIPDGPYHLPDYAPWRTLLVLMGVKTLPEWHPLLADKGYPADLPVAFITWAGRPEQRVLVTTVANALDDANAAQVKAPTVVVLGEVVRLRRDMRVSDPHIS